MKGPDQRPSTAAGRLLGPAWLAYWATGADPVVIDGKGNRWDYDDWDRGRHEPRPGAQPRR